MTQTDTPLRILVKSYRNGLLERDQYVKIRQELLRKLSSKGMIDHQQLENLLQKYQGADDPETTSRYSTSDWIIIILGLLAAGALGVILYG